MWRHVHAWSRPIAAYRPAPSNLTAVRNLTDLDLAYAMVFGLTTLTQTCELCGYARTWTVPGDTGRFA